MKKMQLAISAEDIINFCRATDIEIKFARAILTKIEQNLCKKILLAAKNNSLEDGFLKDPIELDPELGSLVQEARKKAESLYPQDEIGSCHVIWQEQARILFEDYGIEWKSPAEMNPWVLMD